MRHGTSRVRFLAFFSLLLLFQALRNLSAAYFLVTSLVFLYFFLTNPSAVLVLKRSRLPFDLFLLATFGVIAWSFVYMMSLDPLAGIPRILLMPLLTVVLFRWVSAPREITKLLHVGLLAYVVAALTLVYQLYAGPVDWFADFSQRGGLLRYSTILGSLAIFGSIIGYAIVIAVLGLPAVGLVKRLVVLGAIILGMFLSLQKAALVTALMAIAICTAVAWRRTSFKRKVATLTAAAAFVGAFLVVVGTVPIAREYVDTTIAATFGKTAFLSDFVDAKAIPRDSPPLTAQAVTDRMLPVGALRYYGPIVFATGVGLQGGAGVMGMKGYMAHNSFGDLLLMGGPLYLGLFLVLYCKVQLALFRNLARPECAVLFSCNLMFLVNMAVGSGVVFQPASSFPFWLSVVHAMKFLPRSPGAVAAAPDSSMPLTYAQASRA